MSTQRDTTDDDLMDLASRIAYQVLDRWEIVKVNGVKYQVTDFVHDTVTGLDAFTLENTASHEVTVAFQGSQGDTDWQNNAVLITSLTPAQFTAAENYVAGQPRVDFVCGNSLGGGLAADVAAKNPNVRAVTVNPAPVPAEVAGKNVDNVRNYIVDNDMLHQLVVAGGLSDRIIGETRTVKGTYVNDIFGPNHIGSERVEGGYDASMVVPFSLFHDDAVVSAGAFGEPVDIRTETLILMAVGLENQRRDVRCVARSKLRETALSLDAYAGTLAARERAVHDAIVEWFAQESVRACRAVDQVQEFVDTLRPALRRISVPLPLRPFWGAIVTVVVDAVNTIVDGLQVIAGYQSRAAAEATWSIYDEVFLRTSHDITSGLLDQIDALDDDARLVDDKWATVIEMSTRVAVGMVQVDQAMAAGVTGRGLKNPLPPTMPAWPAGTVQVADEQFGQHIAQTVMTLRTDGASTALTLLAGGLSSALTGCIVPPLTQIRLALELIDRTFTGVTTKAEAVVGLAALVSDDARAFLTHLEELRMTCTRGFDLGIEGIQAVMRAAEELPSLVMSLQPQIESWIFGDEQIEQVYDALTMCRNLYERTALTFGEVDFQLSGNAGAMVRALARRSRDVQQDTATVTSSLHRMVS